EPDDLANSDFGDFSCNGTSCAYDSDSIIDADIDDDGNFTFTGTWDFSGSPLVTIQHASVSDDLTIGSDDISFINGVASISSTLWVGGAITGNLTGNARTATELAADPDNCSAGSYPLGIDETGKVESCTDATTEIDSAISTHAGDVDAHHALVTLTGQDYLTLSTQEITAEEIEPDDLANSDFGDFSCNGTSCAYDSDSIIDADIDDDGNFTFTGTWDFWGGDLVTCYKC
ncbi:unnamed protein product, partial [marine sediment metagenome]